MVYCQPLKNRRRRLPLGCSRSGTCPNADGCSSATIRFFRDSIALDASFSISAEYTSWHSSGKAPSVLTSSAISIAQPPSCTPIPSEGKLSIVDLVMLTPVICEGLKAAKKRRIIPSTPDLAHNGRTSWRCSRDFRTVPKGGRGDRMYKNRGAHVVRTKRAVLPELWDAAVERRARRRHGNGWQQVRGVL